ncbi:protein of unknown function, partial [Fodinibius roseus]
MKDDSTTVTRKQFFATLMPGGAPGGAPEKAAAGSEQDEFVSLFNGRTLEGWHTNIGELDRGGGTGGRWTVEQGVITGQQDPPGSGNGGILMTDQAYGDFEL